MKLSWKLCFLSSLSTSRVRLAFCIVSCPNLFSSRVLIEIFYSTEANFSSAQATTSGVKVEILAKPQALRSCSKETARFLAIFPILQLIATADEPESNQQNQRAIQIQDYALRAIGEESDQDLTDVTYLTLSDNSTKHQPPK
ncbi:hypothetical protein ACH5RR_007538 [Cinchona calisaya]|uniref:Uncharacterized protein n=1 Tax=Cinchona calisaya TaxID=153742 RepID=A0ABD3AS41_9GENT